MKLFVTGGAGFIGSNFIRYWLLKYPDDQIVNFDSLTYAGNLENLKEIENNPNYEFIKGDIRDRELVETSMDGAEVVVHFAAESHVDRSIDDPDVFVDVNVKGTFVLLEAALKHKVKRFHHVSTDEVFGSLDLESEEVFDEETPFAPNSPYSASKAGSDHLVRAYFKTFGLPVTTTNTSNNFGPYQNPEKLIPRLIARGIRGQTLPIYGKGINVRDWLYVEDHCRAIDMVLKKGTLGETYLIGGGEEMPNIEIAKKICQLLDLPESRIEFVTDRPGHDLRYAIDNSKAQKELGWAPEHNFEERMRETVSWYKNNQAWWEKLIKTS